MVLAVSVVVFYFAKFGQSRSSLVHWHHPSNSMLKFYNALWHHYVSEHNFARRV